MDKVVENQIVDNLIYEIRGTEVMLDSDLARLYECVNGTKTINQAVKRHINKFPERYMFQLIKEEYLSLKSQMGTSKVSSVGGVRKLPYVFTEQGVAMLATILHTKVADVISMKIIDAFIYMRKYLSRENSNNILISHEERILKLEESFNKFSNKQKSIIYEGKIYDSILLDIFNEAKDEIIIIDNYVNKELLDILRYVDKKIIIMSKNYNEELIKKYKSQYKNIMLVNDNSFHDRYIILDRKEVYTSGMSLKDIGKKYSYINKINESIFIVELLKRVSNVL
ncbi:MAG: ORF6N domain-containing protein [Bacillales bacterium]|nr:ORF6N domain-containing protein [Bacillales bacterium]